jgi:acyl-CoA synthetase (AMP-forming)/AMP-acid ligase II
MGPAYFVIAILGCADGGTSCTPVATLQTRYESAAQCQGATSAALEAHSNFDFPTLVARCRTGSASSSADASPHKSPHGRVGRG